MCRTPFTTPQKKTQPRTQLHQDFRRKNLQRLKIFRVFHRTNHDPCLIFPPSATTEKNSTSYFFLFPTRPRRGKNRVSLPDYDTLQTSAEFPARCERTTIFCQFSNSHSLPSTHSQDDTLACETDSCVLRCGCASNCQNPCAPRKDEPCGKQQRQQRSGLRFFELVVRVGVRERESAPAFDRWHDDKCRALTGSVSATTVD